MYFQSSFFCKNLGQDRWEVGFAISDQGLTNVSFVNSINTIKGGRHVDVILEQIVKKLEEKVNAKNKGKHFFPKKQTKVLVKNRFF